MLPENTQEKAASEQAESEEMNIFEHLAELRTRLLWCVAYLIIGTFGTFHYATELFAIFTSPYYLAFPEASLIGTGPAEAFILKLKVSFFAALFLTSPLLFHQVWLFVAPGLYDSEKRMAIPFIIISTALFSLGCWLCYETILPVTFQFLESQYQSIGVRPTIRVSEHLTLTLRLMVGFGAAFEFPVLVFFLARSGLVTSRNLIAWYQYAIIGVFVIAAIVTPTPDVVTQTLFALPLLILYTISIVVAKVAEPKKAKESKKVKKTEEKINN